MAMARRLRPLLLRPLLYSCLSGSPPRPPPPHRFLCGGPPLSAADASLAGDRSFLSCRAFAFSTSSGSSSPNIVLLDSAERFNTELAKVKDDKSHAIFYFTAAWCGPCRFISPTIEEMSRKFPHVTTYKIDIDQEGLGNILSQLQIYSVPTLHFYQNGKRASEMVGADVAKLKDIMENLYKLE